MSTNTKRWTLKDQYRNLLDAKLSAATADEALDAIEGVWSWQGGWAYMDFPSIFEKEHDPVLYAFLMSLWKNSYVRGWNRYMPKEELRSLLQEVITQA